MTSDWCTAKRLLAGYGAKYPEPTQCRAKDHPRLLAFYDSPAAHGQHIRISNSIGSTFATIRLRSDKFLNCVSATGTLARRPLQRDEKLAPRVAAQLVEIGHNPALVRFFFRHTSVTHITDL